MQSHMVDTINQVPLKYVSIFVLKIDLMQLYRHFTNLPLLIPNDPFLIRSKV